MREKALYPHQQLAVNNVMVRRSCLIVRPLGTGKTAIALHIIDAALAAARAPALLIGPAHLLSQYKDEMLTWPLGFAFQVLVSPLPEEFVSGTCYAVSYELVRMHRSRFISRQWAVTVADEFHHAKNANTLNHHTLMSLRSCSERFVGMTGAPFQNSPHEFFSLVSLVSGSALGRKLEACLQYKRPKDWSWFRQLLARLLRVRANQGPVVGIKDPGRLRSLVSPHVDFHPELRYVEQCGLPKVNECVSPVCMSTTETDAYGHVLGGFRRKRDKLFLEDQLDDRQVDSGAKRFAALRQLLLGTPRSPSSKVLALGEAVRTAAAQGERVLVFCNFVRNGIDVISHVLDTMEVPHARFSGGTGASDRRSLVSAFLSGKTRVLVLSPVGFEGLDLRGATRVFIADPHFNPERTAQIVARATRAETPRLHVEVRHFIAHSPDIPKGTIDEVILRISERRRTINTILGDAISGRGPASHGTSRVLWTASP